MHMIRLYFALCSALWRAWLGLKGQAMAWHASRMLLGRSQRLPEAANRNRLIVLKVLRQSLWLIWKGKRGNLMKMGEQEAPVGIFTGGARNETEMRSEYVRHFSGKASDIMLSRDAMPYSFGTGSALARSFLICGLAIHLLPFSLFSRNRAAYALLLQEFPEWASLLFLVRRHKIRTLHFFNIYEKDSNFLTLQLQRLGVHVNKIPSETPLQ
ncbi:MAG: hypothetical protein AAF570_03635, partial [Bacteroidota bacterium]